MNSSSKTPHPSASLTRPLVGNLRSIRCPPAARCLFELSAQCHQKDEKTEAKDGFNNVNGHVDQNESCPPISRSRKNRSQLFQISEDRWKTVEKDEDGPQSFPMWKVMLELSGEWKQVGSS